ncbi:MAG: NYN domain-containing protein [Chthoniobacteraceae bacterium]
MRYLLVDAHSVIFSWPELHELHGRNGLAAREELTRRLTAYQDATGVRVVAVFDGKGVRSNSEKAPGGIQVFYSGGGKTADCIIERLAAKYAGEHEITAATNDNLVQQTVITFGGLAISVDALRALLGEADRDLARTIRRLRRK